MRFIRWLLSFVPRKWSVEDRKRLEDALLVQEWAIALTTGDRKTADRLVAESWGMTELPKATAGGGSAPLPEPLFAKET